MKQIADSLADLPGAGGKTVETPVGGVEMSAARIRQWKRMGLSDERIALAMGSEDPDFTTALRQMRQAVGIKPVYKLVDTCAAEFESFTPYFYSCYDEEDEAPPTDKKKIIILGSGPNRIGQGIEFD